MSWWFNDPALARDAASIWFTQRLGSPVPADGEKRKATEVGGIMAVHFIPTYGVTGDVDAQGRGAFDTSAINVAAMKVYWDVVHANSRNTSYEASDLMRLFICMDNIYMMLQDAIRAYALAAKYSTINPYIGKALIQASDWDPDSILGNAANFRYKLNRLIAMVNRIHVPRIYNLFEAHHALLSRVFMDGDSVRAQLYICVPNGYYTYEDTTGKVTWVNSDRVADGAVKHKVKDITYLDEIEARIGEVLGSEYMGVMDGDILKRYGAEVMYRVPEVAEDEDIEFVKDGEFNLMLANANFVGVPKYVAGKTEPLNMPRVTMEQPTTATQFIEIKISYEADSTLISNTYHNWEGNANSILINLPDDVEATPENIMLATRMRFVRSEYSAANVASIRSVGTLLGCYCRLWTFDLNNSLHVSATTLWQMGTGSSAYSRAVLSACNQYAVVPRLLAAYDAISYMDVGKVDNFGFVSKEAIDKFNYVAITSIFTEISKNVGAYGVPAYKQKRDLSKKE